MSNQNSIADFTDFELNAIKEILGSRYSHTPELQLADSELRLDPTATELVLCPTAVWVEQGVTFIVFKTGTGKYRNLFYLGPNEQFGTGIPEFTDLQTCVTTLLQVQADYERDNMSKMDNLIR